MQRSSGSSCASLRKKCNGTVRCHPLDILRESLVYAKQAERRRTMKFGLRKPSLRKSIAARTSVKRYIRNSLGLKAPRGWGWLTNPKKAAYNRVYYRTTFGWQDLFKTRRRSSASQGCLVTIMLAVGVIVGVLAAVGVGARLFGG
jgi:hypothetical protein